MKKWLAVAVVLGFGVGFVQASFAALKETQEPMGSFPKKEFVKVAAVQFSPSQDAPVNTSQKVVDAFKRQAADDLEALVREAAKGGAEMVVTAEFATVGYPDIPELSPEEDDYQNPQQAMPFAETIDGPTVQRFSGVAKELRIYLIIGIMEKPKDSDGDTLYNTTVVFNPKGKVIATYHKINLFELENNFLKPGYKRVYFDTEFGRVGLSTCYDIHFDNPLGDLVHKDHVDVIAFSTAWVGKNAIDEFQSVAKANHIYFIAANNLFNPDSGVISPDGTLQGYIHSKSGVVYGYVKRAKK